jgi:DNA (cytosine-5)-methyltransferase 1
LAALGYDCRWTVLGAADVGAPHQRDRFWLVANATGKQHESAPHAQQWQASTQLPADSSSQRHGASQEALCAGRDASEFGGYNLAHADRMRQLQPQGGEQDQRGRASNGGEDVAYANGTQRARWRESFQGGLHQGWFGCADWWQLEPDVGRVAHGVAARVDRLKAIGNGQVPLCAAEAFRLLSADFI